MPSSRGLNTRTPSSDELEEILVARDDRHVEAGRARLHRQRADHVVGLEPLGREHRHAQRFAGLVHERHLLRQIRTASARDCAL